MQLDSLNLLFVAAWAIGVSSCILAVAESIGMWRFWHWVFQTGIRVLQETHSMNLPTVRIDSEFETRSGKFKLVAPQLCLFRFRMNWFNLDIHTPFPIKGSVRWDGAAAKVEGRIPLFTTIFFAAWLIGWTVGGTMNALHGGGLTFLLFGWLFGGGICLFSIPFEIRRARKVLGELKATL